MKVENFAHPFGNLAGLRVPAMIQVDSGQIIVGREGESHAIEIVTRGNILCALKVRPISRIGRVTFTKRERAIRWFCEAPFDRFEAPNEPLAARAQIIRDVRRNVRDLAFFSVFGHSVGALSCDVN
ncbi:hypothetical protein LG047_00175 [Methylocystis sp. WRRC1]|uniref:hypothetical protein n=1 Tax=Methylocystis sp. WRRC1 TaxID=1732014 RepID=UPI001D15031D|nr:hypothetical protein [Methylocystis sp. WRRC1]MCC3243752.1 hypothetical protein [Methylocystis sp. WRRC1]